MNNDEKAVLPEAGKVSDEMADDKVEGDDIPDLKGTGNEVRSLDLKLTQLSQDVEAGLKRVEKMEERIDELQKNSRDNQTDIFRRILEPMFSIFPQIADAYEKLYRSESRSEDALKDVSGSESPARKSTQTYISEKDEDEALDRPGLAPYLVRTLDGIRAEMLTVKDQMEQLRSDFESKAKNDQIKEEIIDRLHKENQDYKRDLLRKVMEPVLLNIIRLMDDYEKLSKHYQGKELTREDGEKLRKSVEDIGPDLEYLLLNQGAEPYSTGEGYFDPKLHRAIKTVETTDETKDKALVETLRPGYRWGDRVIRYEMVSVNVYKKPQSDEERRDANE